MIPASTANVTAGINTAVNCQRVPLSGALLPWQSAFGQLLPLPPALAVTGVYMLYRAGKIIYVGTCKNIYRRVAEHRNSGIKFDKVDFAVLEDPEQRRDVEKLLILEHRPQLNKQHNPKQFGFTAEMILDRLGNRLISTEVLRDEMFDSAGMNSTTFYDLKRKLLKNDAIKHERPSGLLRSSAVPNDLTG